MASRSHPVSAPLTFDLPESLIAKMEVARANHGLKTVSELVRHAVAEFDFASRLSGLKILESGVG